MSSPEKPAIQGILAAAKFAALKHRTQRRRNANADPYINHPITVAELLARVASISDPNILQAALLHDTLEDTETTPAELDQEFGPQVRQLVQEVSDDKRLPKAQRKRLQIEHAPHLSDPAKLIKLADKIANVSDITESEPVAWSAQQRSEYIDWAEQVVAGIRGASPPLEELFDRTVLEKRQLLKPD
jgi:guanosine-3',5'-bis(diphosphate) 3'-pyrophosphohydrolase